jgi:cytochrome c biogenesis protein ResB
VKGFLPQCSKKDLGIFCHIGNVFMFWWFVLIIELLLFSMVSCSYHAGRQLQGHTAYEVAKERT